jgi:hypothetical protein
LRQTYTGRGPIVSTNAPLRDEKGTLYEYPHYHHSQPAGAFRQGDWKLIEWFEDGSLELYNLAESKNLATAMPARAAGSTPKAVCE